MMTLIRMLWSGILFGLLIKSHLSRSEFLQSCPPPCKCSWSAGRNSADCSYKSLQRIPDDFRTELQVLVMDGNHLRQLRGANFGSSNLRHLTDLSLTNCRLSSLSETTFADLTRLVTINLSNNNLTSISATMFSSCDRLEQLILSGNRLSSLGAYSFPALTFLAKLDLSHNVISHISPKAFLNLGHSVKTLDLRGNLLVTLHGQLLLPVYKVQHVFLMDNPWNCDCHLRSFRDHVISRRLSPATVSCYEPERLADKGWHEVDAEDFACKPGAEVSQPLVRVSPGINISIECMVEGSPSPAVRWVRAGRILANLSSPSPGTGGSRMKYIIREMSHKQGDTVTINSSLIIQNVTLGDLDNYSCVAINRGGMAESRTLLALHQPDAWQDILQELIIVISVIGAGIACLCSMIVLKILASRKSASPGGGMSLCTRSVSGYEDMSHQSLLTNSASVTRGLGEAGHNTMDRKSLDRREGPSHPDQPSTGHPQDPPCQSRQYYSSHPEQYPDLINMQLMTQHHHHGQYQEHHGQQSPRHQDYREFREYHHAPVTSPGPDWRTEADHYSGGANEIILMPPSPFSPTYTINSGGDSCSRVKGPEPEAVSSDQTETLQRARKLPKKCPPPTLPKPIIKKQSGAGANIVQESGGVRYQPSSGAGELSSQVPTHK